MVGKLNLMKSSLRRGDLCESNPGFQERNMKKGRFFHPPYKMEENFDINVWKMNMVEWIVDSIEKRSRRRHRIEQMEFVHDREPGYNLGHKIEQMEFAPDSKPGYVLGFPKMCQCLCYGTAHKI